MTETVTAAFAAAVRRDPAAPLLTYYDDATGERTELSGATLANWLSKTANLLVDGVGVGPGDRVGVVLPAHWQTAAILLGAAAAGADVVTVPDTRPVEALFTWSGGIDRVAGWPAGDRYVTGLLPFAMPLRDTPPGFVDYPTEVRNFGDHFSPIGDFGEFEPADMRLSPGDRVLIDARAHPDPVEWLYTPLAAGASIVLCANLDPAAVEKRRSAERITVTAA